MGKGYNPQKAHATTMSDVCGQSGRNPPKGKQDC